MVIEIDLLRELNTVKGEPPEMSVSGESNVLEFGNKHRVAHPASEHFDLENFEDLVETKLPEGKGKSKEYFIHHMQSDVKKTIPRKATALESSIQLNSKMNRLRESTRRLKYYLDEISDNQ
jgi:hypothetical protein